MGADMFNTHRIPLVYLVAQNAAGGRNATFAKQSESCTALLSHSASHARKAGTAVGACSNQTYATKMLSSNFLPGE